MSSARVLAALALTVAVASACHHKAPVAPAAAARPQAPAPVVARPPAAPPPAPAPAPAARGPMALSPEEAFARESLDQLNRDQPLGDAFFAYDSAALQDEARNALETDATWLLRWKQTSVRIEGHCDERGTAEYNLALGQRRADTVRQYLVSLGVDSKRIAITSLGKEAPFCTSAQDDACWSQNRRGHFLITAK
jgi:peptidoglycan-associated lipoprotein